MSKTWYNNKFCLVPACTNSTATTPEKIFVSVPRNPDIRKMWLSLARRIPGVISDRAFIYICEDHFDMERDVKTYVQYRFGFTKKVILKDGVLPSKFNWPDTFPKQKKRIFEASTAVSNIVKKQQIETIEGYMNIPPVPSMDDVSKTPMSTAEDLMDFDITADSKWNVKIENNVLSTTDLPLLRNSDVNNSVCTQNVETESSNVHDFEKVFIRETRNEDITLVDNLNSSDLDNECSHSKKRKIVKVVNLPRKNSTNKCKGNRKKNIILNSTSPIIKKHCVPSSKCDVDIKEIGENLSTNKQFRIIQKNSVNSNAELPTVPSAFTILMKNKQPPTESVIMGPSRFDCDLLSNAVNYSQPFTFKPSEPGVLNLKRSRKNKLDQFGQSNRNLDNDQQILETNQEFNGSVEVKSKTQHDMHGVESQFCVITNNLIEKQGTNEVNPPDDPSSKNDQPIIERKPEINDSIEIKWKILNDTNDQGSELNQPNGLSFSNPDDDRQIETKPDINKLVEIELEKPPDMNKKEGCILSEDAIKKEEPEDIVQYDNSEEIPLDVIKNEVHENDEMTEGKCTEVSNSVEVNCKKKASRETWSISRCTSSGGMKQVTNLSLLLTCPLCDIVIDGTVKDHIENHHRNGIFSKCPFCDFNGRFGIRKSSLCTQIEKHKQQGIIICQFCNQSFHTWLTANIHIAEEHENQVEKKCNLCGLEFESYSELLLHILYFHNGESLVLKCELCDFATLNPALMQMHNDAQHAPNIPINKTEEKKIPAPPKVRPKFKKKCPICGLLLDTSLLYRSHLRSEHD